MSNAIKRTIVPLVICIIALTAIVSSTAFILDSSAIIGNHFQAGNMSLELERTYLEQYRYDNNEMVTYTDNTSKTFTNVTFDNIFGIKNSDLFVPTAKYTANMKIVNTGSLNFNYYFEIKLSGLARHLADQIQVTVLDKDSNVLAKENLLKGVYIGSIENPIGKVNSLDKSSEFTIIVEFLDDENHPEIDNDLAKGESIKFDLIVHAVQEIIK